MSIESALRSDSSPWHLGMGAWLACVVGGGERERGASCGRHWFWQESRLGSTNSKFRIPEAVRHWRP